MSKICSKCGIQYSDEATKCMNCNETFQNSIIKKSNKSRSLKLKAVCVTVGIIIAVIGFQVVVNVLGVFVVRELNAIDHSDLGYYNKEYQFGLDNPEGWNVDENDPDGSDVVFYGPTDEYGITAIINVNFLQNDVGDMLSSMFDYLLESYSSDIDLSNLVVESRNSRVVNDMNAYEIVYTHTYFDVYELKVKEVAIEQTSERIVLLQYSASVSSYDVCLNDFENSVNSVVIS